jgi:signal transduction histidine kinase
VAVVGVCALAGAVFWVVAGTPSATGGVDLHTLPPLADLAIGALSCAAMWWRRRFPVVIGILVALASVVAVSTLAPSVVAVVNVALHRRWFWILPVVAANVVATVAAMAWWNPPVTQQEAGVSLGFGSVVLVALIALGFWMRARRQLVASLRERAERAEADRERSARVARLGERTRIAREMHDVLAHRISLVSMHAGALEYRADATPDEVAAAASVIRENANLALHDLREVIGVLRADTDPTADTGDDGARPQPSLEDVEALLDETRTAGLAVRSRIDLAAPPPLTISRTAYRVLQEGLTNARKHGAVSPVDVTVTGAPDHEVVVDVRNRLRGPGERAAATATAVPGSGTGLVGLAERIRLAGGRLEHGVIGGTFRLRAWLPWT